jgi:hypothetical protein
LRIIKKKAPREGSRKSTMSFEGINRKKGKRKGENFAKRRSGKRKAKGKKGLNEVALQAIKGSWRVNTDGCARKEKISLWFLFFWEGGAVVLFGSKEGPQE